MPIIGSRTGICPDQKKLYDRMILDLPGFILREVFFGQDNNMLMWFWNSADSKPAKQRDFSTSVTKVAFLLLTLSTDGDISYSKYTEQA